MTSVPNTFLVLDQHVIRHALPMADCIDIMVKTMIAVSDGKAELPLRSIMPLSDSGNRLGIMPGYLAEPAVVGAKLVTLFPRNPARGLSSHTGVVNLFDVDTGRLVAILDAAAITALRTPAASAAASRALARQDAGDLAILGAGEQALAHLEAFNQVHDLRRVRLWARNPEKARAFVEAAGTICTTPVTVCATVREAVRNADLVCSATAAVDPILEGDWLSPGAHLSLVGASVQTSAELDAKGVARSRVFVDYRPSALAQAGELHRAIRDGIVGPDHIVAEIGEVYSGRCPGRLTPADITLYKSLGVAAQDLATSHAVMERAKYSNLGQVANI